MAMTAWLLALTGAWDRAAIRAARFYEFAGAPAQPTGARCFLDADAYYWLSYAREMAETGTGRVRWTFADNAPFGRPVHWSQSMAWLMTGAAWLRSRCAGGTVTDNLEPAALWIQPLLLAALAVGGAALLFRTLGLAPALLWLLLTSTSKTLYWLFHPLRPDHHSLQLLFAAGQWAMLAAGGWGWARRAHDRDSRPAARRWFIAAGVAGGLGFWIGASVALLCTGLLIAGMLILFWFLPTTRHGRHAGGGFDPGLWKAWGYAGGLTSLAAYLVEYVPAPLAMRLETNHPLYALWLMAAGELLARAGAWRAEGGAPAGGRVPGLGFAAAGTAALPLALYLGPASWHAMKLDPIRRMCGFIAEFRRTDLLSVETLARWLLEYGAVLLALPVSLWLLASRKTRRAEWAWIGTALTLAGGFLYLTGLQSRWTAFWTVALFWLAAGALAFTARQARKHRPARLAWTAAAVLAFAQPAWCVFEHAQHLVRLRNGDTISSLLTGAVYREGVAQALSTARRGQPWRCLASNPSLAGILWWRAGIPAVTSFYWENLDGLNAAAAFFADGPEGLEARRIAQERGWTHLLLSRPADAARDYYYIRFGSPDAPESAHTLAARLAAGDAALPDWLAPEPALRSLEEATLRFKSQPLPTDPLRIYRINSPATPGK